MVYLGPNLVEFQPTQVRTFERGQQSLDLEHPLDHLTPHLSQYDCTILDAEQRFYQGSIFNNEGIGNLDEYSQHYGLFDLRIGLHAYYLEAR